VSLDLFDVVGKVPNGTTPDAAQRCRRSESNFERGPEQVRVSLAKAGFLSPISIIQTFIISKQRSRLFTGSLPIAGRHSWATNPVYPRSAIVLAMNR
jgi:hypothetical protein